MNNRQMAITLAKRNLVDSIWKSAQIEGLGTTFPKTEAILENLTVDTNREEVLFIVNMKRTWQFLLQTADEVITLAYLRQLNLECGRDLIYGSGELRKIEVAIGGSSYKPVLPESDEVIGNIGKLNAIEEPAERALEYFCYLTKQQLFIDGNKKLAQLVANKVLIDSGVGILSIAADRIYEFKQKLVNYYEDEVNKDDLAEFLKQQIVFINNKN